MTQDSDIPSYLRIEIQHAEGIETFTPTSIIEALIKTPEKMSSLKPTEEKSLISGAPGLIYKTDEMAAPLTINEITRLVFRALTPDEFSALRRQVGPAFEIHDDFYDADTGVALQPKI